MSPSLVRLRTVAGRASQMLREKSTASKLLEVDISISATAAKEWAGMIDSMMDAMTTLEGQRDAAVNRLGWIGRWRMRRWVEKNKP